MLGPLSLPGLNQCLQIQETTPYQITINQGSISVYYTPQELEIMSTNLKLTQNIDIFIYNMQCINFSKVAKVYYIPIFATNAVL